MAAFTFGKSIRRDEIAKEDFTDQFDHIFDALKGKGFRSHHSSAALFAGKGTNSSQRITLNGPKQRSYPTA